MKRFLITAAMFSLIFALFGCANDNNAGQDQVQFYYRRGEYTYGTDETVVSPEQRDITGHAEDLDYLLALYLMGPMDEELVSPFPASVRLLSVYQAADQLTVELTDAGKALTDAQFTLACGCLTKTCIELTDAVSVTILSGERSITMGAEDLLLFDDVIPAESTTEETK